MVVSILWTRKLKFRERRKCIITVEISNGKAFNFCLFCSMLSQQDAHGFVGNHLEQMNTDGLGRDHQGLSVPLLRV